MGLGRTLLFRGVALFGVVFGVLVLLTVVLGATGVSDRVLSAIVNEELRGVRQSLSQSIKDAKQLTQAVEKIRAELVVLYQLDQPWFIRLPDMMRRVLTLDLGNARSLQTFTGSNRVSDLVLQALPNTLLLVTTSTGVSALIGLLLGVKLATRVGSWLDRFFSYFSAVSYALPAWWTGILFILVFSFYVRIFPFGGLYSAPPPEGEFARFLDLLWHAALPVIVLVVAGVGTWIYVTRTIVLNTAQEDFVTVARAKGLPERLVSRRYIVRVAAPPILTNVILGLAGSIGGVIITESVFSWPGMGTLFFNAIQNFEEQTVIALTFMFTVIYVLGRFILEVLYVWLDPRVRY